MGALRITEGELRELLVDRLETLDAAGFERAQKMAARLRIPLVGGGGVRPPPGGRGKAGGPRAREGGAPPPARAAAVRARGRPAPRRHVEPAGPAGARRDRAADAHPRGPAPPAH